MSFEVAPLAELDGEAVLTLDAAKGHLRVLHTDEDDEIEGYRDGAVEGVQRYVKVQLYPAGFVWRGRFSSSMVLGVGPVTEITSITYLDATGATVALTAGDWRIGLHGTVEPGVGKRWPVTADGSGVVTIMFTAGYAAGKIPAPLMTAIRMALTHLYDNRGGPAGSEQRGELPPGVCGYCDLIRLPTI